MKLAKEVAVSHRFVWLLLSLSLGLLAGCGQDRTDAGGKGEGPPPAAGVPASGHELSVREALESRLQEPLYVRGFIVTEGGPVRLCTVLQESYPPGCGGPSLTVQGVDLDKLDGLQKEDGVTWSDDPASLLGTVRRGVLTVSRTSI